MGSVINVWDTATATLSTFEGLTGAEECFTGLFADLDDLSDLAAPLIHIEDSDESKQVMLAWENPASGVRGKYFKATDTFVFDEDDKILRQNVVVFSTIDDDGTGVYFDSVQDSFDNFFAGFNAQDLDMITESYDESVVIRVWNDDTEEETTFEGLDGVRECFAGVFEEQAGATDYSQELYHVTDDGDSRAALLVWENSMWQTATDSYFFNANNKIVVHNVVKVPAEVDDSGDGGTTGTALVASGGAMLAVGCGAVAFAAVLFTKSKKAGGHSGTGEGVSMRTTQQTENPLAGHPDVA